MSFVTQISKCEIDISEKINLLDYKDIFPEQLLVQGYNMNSYRINTTDKSLNIINNLFLENINYSTDTKKITNINRIKMNKYNKLYIEELRKSKDFLNSKFKLHNIYVIKDTIKLDSPFNINISRLRGKTIDGDLETLFAEMGRENYEILFREISLPILISKMLPSIYSHEIIHTQIMSLFGSVNNFFNSEVLPIFIEIIYQYENNFLSTYRINHLQFLAAKLNENNKINNNTFYYMLYYVSIVTAYKLFNIYQNGNIFIKNEILNNIQFVFDNKFTVEELLDKYDLDWTKKRVIN